MGLFDGLVDFGASKASDYAGSAAEWAESAARAGKLPPLSGNQAALGAGVLDTVITHLQPQGCTNVGALRAGSDFLNFLGPTGQSVVSAAGYLADPLLGAALSLGMTEYQQAFGQSCGATPYAPTARVAAGTPPAVPVSSGGAPGVVTQGGGGASGDWGGEAYLHATAHWCVYNPLFLVRVYEQYGGDDASSAYGPLGLIDPAQRLPGESAIEWLRRLGPSYIWSQNPTNGSIDGHAVPDGLIWASVDSQGLHNGFAVWPWELFSAQAAAVAPAWQRDFSKWYKWQVTVDGPEWSVLGFLRQFMASSGFRPDWQVPPPLAEV